MTVKFLGRIQRTAGETIGSPSDLSLANLRGEPLRQATSEVLVHRNRERVNRFFGASSHET